MLLDRVAFVCSGNGNFSMISWLCFEWQTHQLPDCSAGAVPFVIRRAKQSEAETVSKVLQSAFSSDAAWGDINRSIAANLCAATEAVFSTEDIHCLVIVHGNRIIGASLLDTAVEASNHLLSGPCILHEYRNRGLASALLASSLDHLCKNDIKIAKGITRDYSLAARFVYPKFASVSHLFDGNPLMSAIV